MKISLHAEKERYAESISIPDIEMAIFIGEMLEDYPNDPRGASCLILGYSQGRAIHIVCGLTSANWIRIIKENYLFLKMCRLVYAGNAEKNI